MSLASLRYYSDIAKSNRLVLAILLSPKRKWHQESRWIRFKEDAVLLFCPCNLEKKVIGTQESGNSISPI